MIPDDSWFNAFITLLVPGERRQTALTASLISFSILVIFTLVGLQILAILGISFGAFRIAGGILLFFIAFEMIFEKRIERKEKTVEAAITRGHIRNIAAFPLAMPLIAGPGTISATILMARKNHNLHGVITTLLVVSGAILISYFFMRLASPIERVLGDTGRSIVTRLFGVLLAALAIQFVADGMRTIFHIS